MAVEHHAPFLPGPHEMEFAWGCYRAIMIGSAMLLLILIARIMFKRK